MAAFRGIDLDPAALGKEIAPVGDIADRVRLAALGQAAPLLTLQAAQQRREAARIAARRGADDPEVAARLAAAVRVEARLAALHEEIGRARLDPPVPEGEATAGLWGRVAQDGAAVQGVTVVVLAAARRLDFACTGETGGFSFAIPAETPVLVAVRDKDGTELHRDADATTLRAGQTRFREIDLARGAARPCPEPPPEEGETQPMPDLVGLTEQAATTLVAARGLKLAHREEQPAKGKAGLVLSQTPDAGTTVRRGDPVSVVIGVEPQVEVPALVGEKREAAEKMLQGVGLVAKPIEEVPSPRDQVGLVVRQDPAAGAKVAPGSSVRIGVGRLRATTGILDIATRAEEALRAGGTSLREPHGFLAARLAEAGVTDRAGLEALLTGDQGELGKRLALSSPAAAAKVATALRDALRATKG